MCVCALRLVFSTGAVLLTRGHLATFLVAITRGVDAPGIWWMKAGDAIQHLAVRRMAPHEEQLKPPKGNGAEVEEPTAKASQGQGRPTIILSA